jgi:phosphoribosylcarboxyaminoimidazole (NCAIR) mutase
VERSSGNGSLLKCRSDPFLIWLKVGSLLESAREMAIDVLISTAAGDHDASRLNASLAAIWPRPVCLVPVQSQFAIRGGNG